MANTRGRQVVLILTNKSAASVAAGDVVVFDTTTDESFTTTTTGRAELSVGVAQETIASNAVGRILVSGYAALVNVPSSRTRGEYLETHTVVKQATGSATRRSGSFGQFAKTSATPSAWIWGQTDQASTGVADQGTVTYFDFTTAAAPASPAAGKIRVYSKTGDTLAQKTSGGTETVFGAGGGGSVVAAEYHNAAGGSTYTTTSTTFVDVDATNLSLTITTGAHRCQVGFVGSFNTDTSDKIVFVDVDVDGTRVSGNAGGITSNQYNVAGGYRFNGSFTVLTAALTAASHTFKLQWRVDAGTGKLYNGTAGSPTLQFWVLETLAS